MPRHNLILLILLLLTPAGTGFGYLHGTTHTTVSPGEQATFKLYLLAANQSTLTTTTTAPPGWIADTTPSTITFPPTPYRYVSTASGYKKAAPAHITAAVPPNTAPGTYRFTTEIRRANTSQEQAALHVEQVQTIPFTVTVTGTAPETDQEQPPAAVEDTTTEPSDAAPTQDQESGLPIPLIIFEAVWILAIAYLLFTR